MIESESFFTEFTFEGFKNTEPIICCSQRLFAYLQWLEWYSNVKYYFQPNLELKVAYRRFIFSPSIDLWMVNKENQVSLVHLLDADTVQLYKDQPLLKLRTVEHCRKMQMKYMPVDPPEPWLSFQTQNLNFLWGYARLEIKASHRLLTGIFFTEQKFPTLGKLKEFLKNQRFEMELAYSLIFHKIVLADINFSILTDRTPIQSNIEALRNITTDHVAIQLNSNTESYY